MPQPCSEGGDTNADHEVEQPAPKEFEPAPSYSEADATHAAKTEMISPQASTGITRLLTHVLAAGRSSRSPP
jgi:hypothetical protein